MKNTIFLFLAALFISATVNAQSTVDSIKAKYTLQPMPEALTLEKTFPAIGTYQFTTGDASSTVTVSIDSVNKGIVWVEGLPEGKFKAFLKQSPATYRVIAQKTESGTQIPEGTLIFDPSTSTLNIALGKAFNDANPSEVFALNIAPADEATAATEVKVKTKTKDSKKKEKIVFYSATKAQQATSSTGTIQQQQEQ